MNYTNNSRSGNTPVAGAIEFNSVDYLTSDDLLDVHVRAGIDMDENIFGRYGEELLGIFPYVREFGNLEATDSNKFGHMEKDRSRSVFRVDNTYVSGSTSATLTAVLTGYKAFPDSAASSWYAYSLADTETDMMFPVREGDVINAAGQELSVVSVNEALGTFDVEEVQNQNIPAGLENVELWVSGRARGERSTGPKGRETRLIKYENYIQIIDEGYVVSGSALGQAGYLKSMAGTNKWFAQGIMETKTNFDVLCELQIMTSHKVLNPNLKKMFKMEGILPYIENYGHNLELTALESFDLEVIDTLVAEFKANFAPNEFMILESHPASKQFDDAFGALMTNGSVVYDQKMLDLGYNAINRSQVKFYRRSLQAFSDEATLGSADSPYAQTAVFMPTGSTTSFDYGGQSVTKPTINMRYLDVDGENMGYKEQITGGAGFANTNNTDEFAITLRKRLGIELNGGNMMAIAKKAVA